MRTRIMDNWLPVSVILPLLVVGCSWFLSYSFFLCLVFLLPIILISTQIGTITRWLKSIYSTTVRDFVSRKQRREKDPTILSYVDKGRAMLSFILPGSDRFLQLNCALLVTMVIADRVIHIVEPLCTKNLVDSLSNPDSFKYQLIFFVTILRFLEGSFTYYLRDFLWSPIRQNMERKIEIHLFSHLHSLSFRWHQDHRSGQLLQLVNLGTSSIDMLTRMACFNILPAIVDVITGTIFFVAKFNIYFGLFLIAVMVVYIATTIFVSEWRRKLRKERNEAQKLRHRIAAESLFNYENVKYFCSEQYELERYSRAINEFHAYERKLRFSNVVMHTVQTGLIRLCVLAGALYVIQAILDQPPTLTVGDYILFTSMIAGMMHPLNVFADMHRNIQSAFVDMEEIFNLMAYKPEIVDKPDATELRIDDGEIVFDDVSFGYTPERTILHGISFRVRRGETLALVGPSGSGKTTIVRLIFRLFDVTGGSIYVDGQDIRNIVCKSLRQAIGIVPQETVLFNESIRYNISYVNSSASQLEIETAAHGAGIHEQIAAFPEGYSTLVGERGVKLSGGEKQRVSIARTLLKKPRIILLDEDSLRGMCADRTTIVVAHRLSTIVHADRILVLEGGRIKESGTHGQLLERRGRYHAMWNQQQADASNQSDTGAVKTFVSSESSVLLEF